jgi:hypothetical protein
MTRIAIFSFAALTILVTGCDHIGMRGNGHIVTDRRTVTSFTDIEAGGAFQIEWHRGAPGLTITTDQNLLPYIESQVSGTTLHLQTTEQFWSSHGIKVVLSSESFNGANLSGAVRLEAKQISTPKFYLQSHGAARVTLEGSVDELLADLTGAANLNAEGLKAKIVELSGTGASKATVFATESLKVSITGAGKVTYFGNPKTVEKHISGAGSIHPGK